MLECIVIENRERRKFGRRNACATGWIRVRGRPRVLCKIRNTSQGGVFLECVPPAWLPFNFELVVEDTGELFLCEFRHQSSFGVGAAFCDPREVGTQVGAHATAALSDADAWEGNRRRAREIRETRR